MNVDIVKETCCNCHISFWITVAHQKQLLNCKNTFYCPNGHPQSYTGETDAVKLIRCKGKLVSAENSKDRLSRSNSALRGVITKMRNKP